MDKQSFGLRYTDNVYLTPESKTADTYLLLNSRFNFQVTEQRIFKFRFEYAAYSKEDVNDYAGLYLSTKLGSVRSADVYFKLFHKNYVNENAATTDDSYTHTGLGFDFEKALKSTLDLSVTATAAYETRFFQDFDGRNDHQIMALVDADFTSSPRWTPYVYGDLGLVFSSQSAYSTYFMDMGVGAKGPMGRGLLWLADLDFRSVSYLNRTVNETVEITRRRGTTQVVDVTDNEKTQSLRAGGGVRWSASGKLDLESRLNTTQQYSNNPNFAYQNHEILLSLTYAP